MFYVFQEPLCTAKELECVENIKADTSLCLKPCSGLIVNNFYKSELNENLETLFPIFGKYNNYKKVTPYPSGQNGKQLSIVLIVYDTKYFDFKITSGDTS